MNSKEKDDEITRLRAITEGLFLEIQELRLAALFAQLHQVCPKVSVWAPDSGLALFTGRLIAGAPWAYWHRVVPDNGYVDLPPGYKVKKLP